MSIKESFDVEGMHTSGGLVHLKDRLAAEDAEVVKRLKEEGAIILNKTNTPSLCFCQETDNFLYGRSNNPWNPDYTTGGSSGGEAGLMALGGAAAGLGSDIGGSIRIPSHFNGVVGFKSGAYQLSQEGHLPFVREENQQRMIGIGPVVKSVRDAALVYSILHPSYSPPASWTVPACWKVVSFGDFHKTRCSVDTVNILEEARKCMQDYGAIETVFDNDMKEIMKDVAVIWQLIMSMDGADGIYDLAYPQRHSVVLDYIKAKTGFRARNHPYLSWAIIGARLFAPGNREKKRIKFFVEGGRTKIVELLGDNGVFLIPTYPTPAKAHGQVYAEIFSIRKTFRWVLPYIALANVFGLPSLVVPCGKSSSGLPIGLQVVSTVGNEDLVFKVGALLESHFGGYRRIVGVPYE